MGITHNGIPARCWGELGVFPLAATLQGLQKLKEKKQNKTPEHLSGPWSTLLVSFGGLNLGDAQGFILFLHSWITPS